MKEVIIEVGGDNGDGNIAVVAKSMGIKLTIIDHDNSYIDDESKELCPQHREWDENEQVF